MANSAAARLAIDGGTPVRSTRLPYGRQLIDQADIDAVVAVLRSDFLTTGPRVAEFEEAFADAVGARHAVAVSSGTAALHAASFVAGLGPGTEAITTPLTFAATANCVRYVGATVVFADVRSDTLTIDPDLTARAVTPKTRAILPVDYAGQPADLDDVMRIAERHGLTVIEDACHAFGARYRGRKVGSFCLSRALQIPGWTSPALMPGTTDGRGPREKPRWRRNDSRMRSSHDLHDAAPTRDVEEIAAPPAAPAAQDARVEDDEVDQAVAVPAAEAAGGGAAPARRDFRPCMHVNLQPREGWCKAPASRTGASDGAKSLSRRAGRAGGSLRIEKPRDGLLSLSERRGWTRPAEPAWTGHQARQLLHSGSACAPRRNRI